MLQQLVEELQLKGIQFRVARHIRRCGNPRTTGISGIVGGVSRYTSLADIVEDFERDQQNQQTEAELLHPNSRSTIPVSA